MLLSNHRSHDAVITVCQDNMNQAIEIRELNKPAEDILGYEAALVTGRSLMNFLPLRIQTLLNEYVEFEEDGNDVGNVLSKVQSFCVVNHLGKEIAFRLKVSRAESTDKNAYFRLILQDKTDSRKDEAFRAVLRDNFKGHEVLEPHTGLPDRNSIGKDLELVHYYVNKEALKACFAIIELDNFEGLKAQYGAQMCFDLLKHMASIAKQNLRGDDTFGCVSEHALGIILMDTNVESCRMVLNRLRWLMAASPLILPSKETIPATVSIAFSRVGSFSIERELMAHVEQELKKKRTPAGNALVEVPE